MNLKPSDLKGQRIGNKLANETTTSCQLVQNFLICAVETSRLHKLKSFGLIGRHSKLYCLCSRDIQNFIVCAVETFKTLLFVQSRHSKLYCLCSRAIRNFLVCVSLLGLRIVVLLVLFFFILELSHFENQISKFDVLPLPFHFQTQTSAKCAYN